MIAVSYWSDALTDILDTDIPIPIYDVRLEHGRDRSTDFTHVSFSKCPCVRVCPIVTTFQLSSFSSSMAPHRYQSALS